MAEELPDDPMTMAQQGWVAFHEIFTQLRDAGFTLTEAASVMVAMLHAQQAQQQAMDKGDD